MPGIKSPGDASRDVQDQAITPAKDGSAERIHIGDLRHAYITPVSVIACDTSSQANPICKLDTP